MKLKIRFKGGPGSGFHGHSGRKGQVGGSSSSGTGGETIEDRRAILGNNVPHGYNFNGYVATRRIFRGKRSADVHIRASENGYEYDILDNKNYDALARESDISLDDAIDKAYDAAQAYASGKIKAPKAEPVTYDKPEYINSYDDVQSTRFGKGYLITGDNSMVDISGEFSSGTNDHPGYIAALGDPSAFGLSPAQAKTFAKGYEDVDSSKVIQGWKRMHDSGVIRVREFGKSSNIDTKSIDTPTLRRLQKLYDVGKLHIEPGKTHYWSSASGMDNVSFTYEDFLNAKFVVNGTLR